LIYFVSTGVISSSIGTILKAHGLRVTAIKIDPYLNIDAGTFSPFEHGMIVKFLMRSIFVMYLYIFHSKMQD